MDEIVQVTELPSKWRGIATDTRALAPGNHHPHADTYESCAEDLVRATQVRVTAPGDEIIHVPHTPEAEAALLQECRERLGHLKQHLGRPETVAAIESLDKDLEALMQNVATTESYDCPEFRVLDPR